MVTTIDDPVDGPVTSTESRTPRLARWQLPLRHVVAGWNVALIVIVVVVFAVLGWQQRWISDDGLIVLRTVRQVLEGNGPVFNAGERVEVNTSTLWTYLLVLLGLVAPGVPLETVSIMFGLACSVAGMGLGLDAARRLHAASARRTLLVPLGAVILLALPPVRDFATSGLETGLVMLWLTGSWWLLVRCARQVPAPSGWAAAIVLGLGPLVRPDLGLFSAVGFAVLAAITWRGWRRLAALAGVMVAAPLAYEIFRAGYYGVLLPNTGLAKEASRVRWEQGLVYLGDLLATYWLWIPLACALLALGLLIGRHGGWTERTSTVLVTVAPLLAGFLMAVYVVRVGGDFMHGRMLLPALTTMALPLLAVPLTWLTAVPVLGIIAWAVVSSVWFRFPYGGEFNHTGIVDERMFYSARLDVAAPRHASQYIDAYDETRRAARAVNSAAEPSMLLIEPGEAYWYWRAYPTRSGVSHTTVPYLQLGMMGAAVSLDARVHDSVGLANPLASHATPIYGGRIGHDKSLPVVWLMADQMPPGVQTPFDEEQLYYARRALACPEIQEMLDSVRAPLTFGRFMDNLVGAWHRTELRYSRLPQRAAEQCGTIPPS